MSAPLVQAARDAATSVATVYLCFRFGALFHTRFLARHRRHYLFLAVFALSTSLLALIALDAVDLMHASSRRIFWLLDVYLLLAALLVALPHAALAALRWPRIAPHLALLLIFWRGVRTPPGVPDTLGVDAAMVKLLIVGTTMLAVLSGVSAVHLPYAYLVPVVAPVSEAKLAALHHKAAAALHSVLLLKRPRPPHSVQPASATPDAPRKALAQDAPRRALAPASPRKALASAAQVRAAERAASAAFTRYARARTRFRAGRLSGVIGLLLLLLCVGRVVLALSNTLSHSRSSPAGAAGVSASLHAALRVLGVRVDAARLYRYATLAFTAGLLAVNLRAALLRMTAFVALLSSDSNLDAAVPLLLGQLMGIYVISSTILMRSFLPPGSRLLIADVLGALDFAAVQAWFDYVFLATVAVALAALAYTNARTTEPTTLPVRHDAHNAAPAATGLSAPAAMLRTVTASVRRALAAPARRPAKRNVV